MIKAEIMCISLPTSFRRTFSIEAWHLIILLILIWVNVVIPVLVWDWIVWLNHHHVSCKWISTTHELISSCKLVLHSHVRILGSKWITSTHSWLHASHSWLHTSHSHTWLHATHSSHALIGAVHCTLILLLIIMSLYCQSGHDFV